ncbi:MAG: tetratricopeptide repeat protein [Chloroflexota bacterium]|nr:tetratricopeptide repeat protein [Chloroflexota bacterium]
MATPGREEGSARDVATSKFAVPRRRPDVVRRPRLNAFIDSGIGAKGALIAAPAGYGKTTLVVDWRETSDFAVVWLSLDAWDADLPAFTRALAQAIRARFQAAVQLGDERFWQPRTVATVLINAIAEQDDYVVLVLDDVHTVESSADVMETLGYLLERAPENLHIVMTSRTRPPVPSLARLMARRDVMTIGAGDLAFTPREVRDLLASLGRAVSDDEAEMLYERTEGWAAAIILGAGAMEQKSPLPVSGEEASDIRNSRASGPNVGLSLADYAQGEALVSVPESVRAFLRSVSLLPIWTPGLCNDITGRRDSERLLREAASQVLFVTQHSDEPPTYRCHQLMRTLLMQQYRTADPDGFAEAGRSTAETLTRFGMLNEAIDLLFELEEWDGAGATLEQIAPRLIQQGQARGLAEWIDRLPADSQTGRPYLRMWRARAAYKLQNLDEALRLIDDSLTVLRERGDDRGTVEALFVRGETQRLKGYYTEALETFADARSVLEESELDDVRLAGEALRHIGITHTLVGALDAAVEELEEGRRLLEQVGDLEGIAHTCHSLAQCYSRRGEPMQALGALQRGRSALERAGNTYDLGVNLNNTGMLYYDLGEYDQALQVYERALRVVRATGDTRVEAVIMTGTAEAYRNLGRLEESLALYQEAQPIVQGLQVPDLMAEFTEGLALTRLALGQGEDAARLIKSVAPLASAGPARIAQHALIESQLALERGDPQAALKIIEPARLQFLDAGNRNGTAVAAFVRAQALFDAHQPRRAMKSLEEADAICHELGYHRFLRSVATRRPDMLEYARVRHIASGLLTELAAPLTPMADDETRGPEEERPAPAMVPVVRAFAFGRGMVMVGDRQVSDLEWRSEKSKEMLFLLLSRKQALPKEEIFAALWPELPESKCNSNFHSSLYRLRRAIFHECVVREAGGAYALNPKGEFLTDLDGFNRAMLEAEVARDETVRAARLQEAVSLYTGPYLSSTYSDWAEPLRRELEVRYIEALNELAALRLREGAFVEALALFKAVETADSYSEAAAYGVMRCYIGLNDGPAAARHFRRFRQLLRDDLDEEPSPRLDELYREASVQS